MPFMSLLQPALALKIIHRLKSDELLKPSEAGDLLPSVFGLLKYFPSFMSVLVLVSVKDLFLSHHILGIAGIDTLPNLSSSKCKKVWYRKICQNVGVVTLSFSH